MKKIIAVSLAVFSLVMTGLPVQNAVAAVGENGQSTVSVANCARLKNGVRVLRANEKVAVDLYSGTKDAGHGLRYYTFECQNLTSYLVKWTEVDTNTIPTNVNFTPVIEPITITIPVVTKTKPVLTKISALENNKSTYLGLNFTSFKTGKVYGSELPEFEIANTVPSFAISAQTKTTDSKLTYGFVWTSNPEYKNINNEAAIASIAKLPTFTTNASVNFNATEYYRGKHVVVIAFVRNNDGISEVPNMPVEVDDVIYLPLHFAKLANAPTPVPVVYFCAQNGQDITISTANIYGLYGLCDNFSIFQKQANLSFKLKSKNGTKADVEIHGALTDRLTLTKNTAKSFVGQNNTTVKITYTGVNENGQALFYVSSSETVTTPEVSKVVKDGYNEFSYNSFQHSPTGIVGQITAGSSDKITIKLEGKQYNIAIGDIIAIPTSRPNVYLLVRYQNFGAYDHAMSKYTLWLETATIN